METCELINLILDFGTFLTAIVSLLTLWEMRKQRLTSIQPDIVLQNFNSLHLYHLPKLHLFASWPYLWSTTQLGSPDCFNCENNDFAFKILLKNVGSNTAKVIRYQWEYDIEQYMTALARLNIDASIFYETNTDGRITVTREHSISFLPNINNQYIQTSYLPVGDQCQIPFCESYTQFVSLWLSGNICYLIGEEKPANEDWKRIIEEFENFSPLSLIIKYSDLLGNEYTRKYTFLLSFSALCATSIDFSVDIVSE